MAWFESSDTREKQRWVNILALLGHLSASGWKGSMWMIFVTLLEVEVGRNSCQDDIVYTWASHLLPQGRATNSPYCWEMVGDNVTFDGKATLLFELFSLQSRSLPGNVP